MNENYKIDLLKHLTGNITKTQETSTPYYQDVETTSNDFHQELNTICPGGYQIDKSIKCLDGNGKENGKILHYGSGYTTDYENVYFIVLTDNEMNILKTMTTFSSGTPLNSILALDVDETGYFYGIDYVDDRFRIILLNNISEPVKQYGDYRVVLRNSYNVQGYIEEDEPSPYQPAYIKKSKQSATYYFALTNSTNDLIEPSTFKINVGATNEWTRFEDIVLGYDVRVLGYYVYFDVEDRPTSEYYAIGEISTGYNSLYKMKTFNTANTEDIVLIENIDDYIATGYQDIQTSFDTEIMGVDEMYLVVKYNFTTDNTHWTQGVKGFYIKNTKINELFDKYKENGTDSTMVFPDARIGVVDKNLFVYFTLQNDPSDSDSVHELWFYFHPFKEDVSVYEKVGNLETNFSPILGALINNYNLHKFYYIYRELNSSFGACETIIYNNENYNGEDYTDYDSLVGKQSILLDANNKPIFARNLYNYKTYNNRAISVLNVPNNVLNDKTIATSELIGKTNSILIADTGNITKNIYENLFINYFISVNMISKIDTTSIKNRAGAIKLTQSAFNNQEYENAKCNKIKVYYQDGTSMETETSASITDNVATYEIILYCQRTNPVIKMDFLSNDESIIYHTIPEQTWECYNQLVGYYKFTQKVKVE